MADVMSSNSSLKQILERSKLLTAKIQQRELPAVERDLGQIEAQSKKLAVNTATQDTSDLRAHYFLAQGGINTQLLVRELGTIHIGTPASPHPIHDTNVEAFLHRKHTQTITELVQDEKQEILQKADAAFDKDLDESLRALWERSFKEEGGRADSFEQRQARLDPSRLTGAGSHR